MKSISLLFCGDFSPNERFEPIALETQEKIFGSLLADINKADISFVNLETPLCHSESRTRKEGQHLRANPDCIKSLSKAGFNVVGLANNHIMDFGPAGLLETMAACDKTGISHVGAGNTISDARKPLILVRNGVKVAIIAATEFEFSIATETEAGANPIDTIDLVEALQQARNEAELIIVTIHGGNEYHPFPRPGLRKLCRFLVRCGAHAVICHHPHVPGAYELFRGQPIVYSLGNLIFDHHKPPSGWDTGYAVRLTFNVSDKIDCTTKFIPYRQSVTTSGVKVLCGQAKQDFISTLEKYRAIIEDDSRAKLSWDNYVSSRENFMLTKNYLPFSKGIGILSRIPSLARLLLPTEKTRMSKLNMLQCESHLELLRASVQSHSQKRNINE